MNNASPDKHVYSIKQVRELTGFCNEKVYQHIRAGQLIARKCGRRTIVLASDLERFLHSLPRLDLGSAR
jgi:hypothetical protein